MRRRALALLALAVAGFSPFQREEEHVRAGNERLEAGDPAGARSAYDAAEQAVGPRPEIDFDRGHAALRAGEHREAEGAFRRAARAAPPALASRALQNAGSALAAAGDRDGAARAFEDALVADPANEDARWNLEVLLRGRAPERPPPQGGEGDEGGEPRADAGAAPPPKDQAQPSSGTSPPVPAPAQARPSGERTEAGAAPGGEDRALSRQDAEALLDALRAGERNAPLFGRERKEVRRSDGGKDW